MTRTTRWRAAVFLAIVLGAGGVGVWKGAARSPRAWALGSLQALRIAHRAAWAVAWIGVAVLGRRVARGRRLGLPRPRAARLLLLCGATALGLCGVEAASFAYRARAHRVRTGSARAAPARAPRVADAPITVAVLGESSARGFPYCRNQSEMWASIGQLVAWQLGRVFPEREIRVQILAEDGATLEGALRRLDDLADRPDAVILYAGHNEVAGRFPLERRVAHYADETTWADRLAGWVRRASPADRLIQEALDLQAKGEHPNREERRLIDVPACTPAELARLRVDFRARLDGFLAACRRLGALPILIIPPGNDGGFEPNRSVLDPALTKAAREALARRVLSLRAAETADPAGCLSAYRALVADHPEFAEAHFRLARLLERSGASAEANRHYILARDRDGLPLRCVSAYEEAYRTAAGRDDCVLVDGPAVLRALTSDGILDGRVLHDAQHPSLFAYLTLATDLLGQLRRRGAFGWPRGTPAPTIDPAECAAHFEINHRRFAVACYFTEVMWWGARSYRYEDAERRALEARYHRASEALMAGVPPERLGLLGLLKLLPEK